MWANAFQAGIEAITKYGGAEEGMRTLLDALCPATRALLSKANEVVQTSTLTVDNSSVNSSEIKSDDVILKSMLSSARDSSFLGMENTKNMLSLAGRSNYVNAESMQGIPDPGAYAVYIAFNAIAKKYAV